MGEDVHEDDWDPSACEALARGLDLHPDEVYALLRAVRDDTGDVVDLQYEWVSRTALRGATTALVGRRLSDVYSPEELLVLPDMLAAVGTGQSAVREVWFDQVGEVAARLSGMMPRSRTWQPSASSRPRSQ